MPKQWTAKQIETLVDQLAEIKGSIDTLKETQKQLQEKSDAIEVELMDYFSATEKKAYIGKSGKLELREYLTYKTPKTIDDKKKFFSYLQKKGEDVFYSLASVNSQTLNAFCKRETENAVENGIFPFTIDGIEEPSLYKKIIFKKNK